MEAAAAAVAAVAKNARLASFVGPSFVEAEDNDALLDDLVFMLFPSEFNSYKTEFTWQYRLASYGRPRRTR